MGTSDPGRTKPGPASRRAASRGWPGGSKGVHPGLLGAVVCLLLAAACTSTGPASSSRTSGSPSASSGTSLAPAQPTEPTGNGAFTVSPAQAERIAVVVAFLHAYNAGQADRALALFASAPAVSDCDYQAVRPVSFVGRSQVASWLRARIADHDR